VEFNKADAYLRKW